MILVLTIRVYNYYVDNLVKAKKKKKKFNEKNYKDMTICFTEYLRKKSIKLLFLYCHELKGKVEGEEGKSISWFKLHVE